MIDDLREPEVKFTTRDVERALSKRYGTNNEHLVVFQVSDAVGTAGRQYCDAIAVSNWQKGKHLVHGFEIKISRSDWLRELKQVEKADRFINRVDRWWLVTGSKSIAKPEEIPACWGWLSMSKGGGLRLEKPAPNLPLRDYDHSFMIAIMRRCYERGSEDKTLEDALAKQRDYHDGQLKDALEQARRSVSREYAELRERVSKFEKASGIQLEDWRFHGAGDAVRALMELEGYQGNAQIQISKAARELIDMAAKLNAVAESVSFMKFKEPKQ